MRKSINERVACVEEREEADLWKALTENYLKTRIHRGIFPSTIRTERRVLALFRWFLERASVKGPPGLRRAHLEEWETFLTKRYRSRQAGKQGIPITGTTVYGWTSMVLGFVGFLVKTDRLLVDPRVGFERAKYHRQPRRFIPTIEEVARLLDGIEPTTPMATRDRAILELFYSTGLRLGELHRLDLYDLDLRRCQVQVREGKGGRDRVLPFGARARAALEDYLKETRPLWWTPAAGDAAFLSQRGLRMARHSIGRIFQLWRRRLRLPFLTAHRLRHACATHLLLRGADMRFVQQMMGHREITTTQRYTHLVPMDLAEVHKKTHPRGAR